MVSVAAVAALVVGSLLPPRKPVADDTTIIETKLDGDEIVIRRLNLLDITNAWEAEPLLVPHTTDKV